MKKATGRGLDSERELVMWLKVEIELDWESGFEKSKEPLLV